MYRCSTRYVSKLRLELKIFRSRDSGSCLMRYLVCNTTDKAPSDTTLPPSGGGGGGGGGGFRDGWFRDGWFRDGLHVFVGGGVVGALATLYIGFKGIEQKEKEIKQKEKEFEMTDDFKFNAAMEAIPTQKLDTSIFPYPLITRDVVEKKIMAFMRSKEGFDHILLVAGARGAGKTTVVKSALKDIEGVIYANPVSMNIIDVCESLLHSIGCDVRKPSYLMFSYLLKMHAARGLVRPIVVIDLHTSWSMEELKKLFEWAKSLGPDNNLACFVFVFSQSIQSLKERMNFSVYRTIDFLVDEPTDTEFEKYVLQNLTCLNFSHDFSIAFSKSAILKTGKNFLLYKRLFGMMTSQPKESRSEDELKLNFNKMYERDLHQLTGDFSMVLKSIRYSSKEKQKKEIIDNLCKGESVGIDLFLEVFHLQYDTFVDAAYKFAVHPLVLSFDNELYVPSEIMRTALKEAILKF